MDLSALAFFFVQSYVTFKTLYTHNSVFNQSNKLQDDFKQ
jgi:hypothetical protein